jgi:LPXTG-motif cell wall-anchored protein
VDAYIGAAATNETYTAVDDLGEYVQSQISAVYAYVVDVNNTMYDQLDDIIAYFEDEIGYVADDLDALTTTVANVNQTIYDIADDSTEYLETQIATIYSTMNDINRTIYDITDDIYESTGYLEAQIADVWSHVGVLENQTTTMDATIKILVAKLANINPKCLMGLSLGAEPDVSQICPDKPAPSPDSNKTGVIIAAVFGAIFGVGIAAIAVWFFSRRKKHNAMLDEHLISLHTPLNPNKDSLQDL